MDELKFLKGAISDFEYLSKNDNFFYLVNNNGVMELYIGDILIAKSSDPEKLVALQEQINLATGVDMSSFYTKSQIDELLADLDVDVDLTDYYTKSETYSKSEVDSKLTNVEVDLSDYYTKSETYSKEEVDSKLTNVEVDLDDYYTKSETYSQTEVDEKIKAAEVDLSNYYTKEEIDAIIYENITKALNTPT